MNHSPGFDSAKSLDAPGDPRDTGVMQLTEIDPVRLNRVNSELNMARFNEVDLQLALLGEVSFCAAGSGPAQRGRR